MNHEPNAETFSNADKHWPGCWSAIAEAGMSAQRKSQEKLAAEIDTAECLFREHRYEDAARAFSRALNLDERDAAAWVGLGVCLHHLGLLVAAIWAYGKALASDIDCALARVNLGVAFEDMCEFERAERWQRQTISRFPLMASAHNSLGAALMKQGKTGEAMPCFLRALALEPEMPGALINIGYNFQMLGNSEAAKKYYERAIASGREAEVAHFYRGLLRLQEGDFHHGWQDYELRREARQQWSSRRDFSEPRWRGEPLNGASILLFSEQGLGDTIQFARYVPMVAARGGRVILEVQRGLRRLLGRVAGVNKIVEVNEPLPDFDCYSPLMSLPLLFETTLATIPNTVPYVAANAALRREWAARLSCDALKVGLVWGGNPEHPRERWRAIPLNTLAELCDVEGARFYSLQKGAAAAQMKSYTGGRIIDLNEEQRDFAETAAIVANLDLVISIDTSVAHLAGAMARPLWLALHHSPDWRWMLNRNDTPWYPTARLFRKQMREPWSAVVEKMKFELQRVVQARENRL